MCFSKIKGYDNEREKVHNTCRNHYHMMRISNNLLEYVYENFIYFEK